MVAVDPAVPDADVIARAAGLLRAGGLVAFPTETVYGLGANALDRLALERIYEAKRRPATDPIIAHIADIAQLDMLTDGAPALAYTLAEAFWPGPLTIVLRRADAVPETLARGMTTVAIRMPSHPVAQALIREAGVPVGAPSANRFTRPSGTTAADVLEDLDGVVDMVLDGGAAPLGLESTIVDLTADIPVVLRPGSIAIDALRAVDKRIIARERYLAEHVASNAPGQMLRHYSPRAEVLLFSGGNAAQLWGAMAERALSLLACGGRPGFLLPSEQVLDFEAFGPVVDLGPECDPAAAGRALFAGLRRLDRQGADAVLVVDPGHDGLAAALRDRLLRAAEGRVVLVGAAGGP